MLSDIARIVVPAAVTAIILLAGFAVWLANRKRIAAETIGRAEETALRIAKDADRDAETRRKEAMLEAKEKAHEIVMEAERQARQDRQQAAQLEQTLTRREAAAAERQAAIERLEKELNSRDRALSEREKTAAAAAAKYEQLVSNRSVKRTPANLIATSRPIRASRALYTSPMPPAPMGARIS